MNTQKAYEKMLNVTNHQGNASNQSNKISPHTYLDGQHQINNYANKQKNPRKQEVLERIQKIRTLCTWLGI